MKIANSGGLVGVIAEEDNIHADSLLNHTCGLNLNGAIAEGK